MKAFARFTAIIFMVLGVIIILIGAYLAISGVMSVKTANPTALSVFPDMSGLVILARLIIGAAVGIQGLFLAAIGQAIWLLANISDHTQKTSEYLGSLVRRTSQPKQ